MRNQCLRQSCIFLVCISLLATGCDNSESFNERAQRVSRIQAKGATGSTVTIKRAYNYDGHSYHEAKPGQMRVGVDVEFRNPNAGLDLDDLEIVDGKTNKSLGSYPDIYWLTTSGELEDPAAWSKDTPNDSRILLIYQVPAGIASIKLRYWDKDLTREPFPISGEGPRVIKNSK